MLSRTALIRSKKDLELKELEIEAFDDWGKEATQEALKDFLHPSHVEIVSQKDHNLYGEENL